MHVTVESQQQKLTAKKTENKILPDKKQGFHPLSLGGTEHQ